MEEAYVEVFSSPGCVGCPLVKRMIEEIAGELENVDLEVEEVDITISPERAAEYGIMAVPAVVVNGILKCTGEVSREELKAAILEEMAD
jgi:small redox-active disulfide protein 1